MRRQGRRHKQLLDDLKEREATGNWKREHWILENLLCMGLWNGCKTEYIVNGALWYSEQGIVSPSQMSEQNKSPLFPTCLSSVYHHHKDCGRNL